MTAVTGCGKGCQLVLNCPALVLEFHNVPVAELNSVSYYCIMCNI